MVGKNLSKKLVSLGLILTLSLGLFSGCKNQESKSEDQKIKIGISQIVEHDALDMAREGFLKELSNRGYTKDKIDVDLQIAQGDMALTSTIANNFVSDKKDLILAISTPSAQSVKNATKDIPILFTAVTDPISSNLLKNSNEPEENITGTTDMIHIKKNLILGKTLIKDSKNVGFVYNTSEVNTKKQLDMALELSKELDLNIIKIPITNTSEVQMAVSSKIDEVDFIFLPSDNMVASSLPIIAKTASKKNIALIGCDEPMIQKGALACFGIDYFKLGKQTGAMAADILDGKEISKLPVASLDKPTLIINEDVLKELNLNPEKELLDQAKLISSK